MTRIVSADQPDWRPRIATLVLLAIAASTIAIGSFRAREDGSGTSDFDDFWRTASRDYLLKRTMTDEWGVHNYLPFFAILMGPFGLLPLRVAAAAFGIISCVAAAATFLIIDVGLLRHGGSPARPVRWVPAALAAAYAIDCIVLGQVALLTLLLIVAAWYLFEQQRSFACGMTLALAASIKLLPMVLGIYFLLRREGRVLAGLLCGLALFNGALPAIAFGPSRAWELHRAFWQRSAVGESLLALALNDSDKMSYANQSLPIVTRRLTMRTHTGLRDPQGMPKYVNLVDLSRKPMRIGPFALAPVQWIVLSVAAVLSVAVLLATLTGRRPTIERMRCEFAAFLLLSMVLSPVLWTFYFLLAYPALALSADAVFAPSRGRGPAAIADRVLLALWAIAVPLLAIREARAIGLHLLLTILLLFAMLRLSRDRATASRHQPPQRAKAGSAPA